MKFTGYKDFMTKAPTWLVSAIEAMTPYQGVDWKLSYDDEGSFADDKRKRATGTVVAEVLGSKLHDDHQNDDGDEHLIVVDVDENAAFIESSTEGHHHLVFEMSAPWEDYLALLKAMHKCGIVEDGYVAAAEARGEAFIRPPWVRKSMEREDVSRALLEWLDVQPQVQSVPDPSVPF